MNYSEDLATAADLLKKAVPHMVAKKIPANPVNYTLWYNYVANYIPALNKALDALTSGNARLTQEQSIELYKYYIISEHLEDHQNTLDSITQLAEHIVNRLSASMQSSEHFDEELSQNIDALKQASSIDEVTTLIDQVINASEQIRSANSDFKAGMEQANEEINSLRHELALAEKEAYVDQLTQLYNRNAFDRQLKQLLQNDTVAADVCLILTDLDHFKSFNDDYGHVIGDRVLQRMGELIQDYCPDNAIGARYGGEEFAIILSNASEAEASEVAEKLRQKIQQLRVKIKSSDKVLDNITASFGVTRFRLGESIECFIDRADQALYSAKRNGRNRVEAFQD